MCVAVFGKVLKMDGKNAVVDFNGSKVSAKTGLVDVAEGDKVLVHAGCILQKVSDEDIALSEEFF